MTENNLEKLYKDVIKNKFGYYELLEKPLQDTCNNYYKNTYYQSESAQYTTTYSTEELENKWFQFQEKAYILKNYMKISFENNHFLDIGCGEGFALKYFSDAGFTVTGIDLSIYGCKVHNPSMVENVRIGNAEAELTNFPKDSYKGIIQLDHVLEHVMDPVSLMEKITAIAHKGTCLIVSVPNDFSKTQLKAWELGVIDCPYWVLKPDHISYFNKDGLQAMIESYGWHMEFITGDYPIDFNLYNPNTNYRAKRSVGKSCHEAALTIEKLLYDSSLEETIKIYHGLGKLGLGRDIIEYFIL